MKMTEIWQGLAVASYNDGCSLIIYAHPGVGVLCHAIFLTPDSTPKSKGWREHLTETALLPFLPKVTQPLLEPGDQQHWAGWVPHPSTDRPSVPLPTLDWR
jgi:hypothetical protein